MLIQDLDSTTSYRTVARGFGCGFARAYQASQRDRAGSCAPGRSESGGLRPFGGTGSLDAARVEQRRQG